MTSSDFGVCLARGTQALGVVHILLSGESAEGGNKSTMANRASGFQSGIRVGICIIAVSVFHAQ